MSGGYGGPPHIKRDRQMEDMGGYNMPPPKRMMPAHQGGMGGYQERGPMMNQPGGRTPYGAGDGYGMGMGHPPQPVPLFRPQTQNQPSVDDKPSFVLLFTVFNPKYPITVDVIHTITSADNRTVNRIMIFRKNGVQVMVEFDSVDTAERAREALNGADIYSGCCTLKIEYAKPLKLAVVKNDADTYDYTNPHLGKEPPQQKSVPLLPDPKFSETQSGNGNAGHYGGGPPMEYEDPGMGPPRRMGGPPPYGGPMGGPIEPPPRGGYDYGYEGDGYGRPDGYEGGYGRRGGAQQPGESRYPSGPGRPQPLEPYEEPYGPPGRGGGRGGPPGRGGLGQGPLPGRGGRGLGRGGPEPLMRGGYRGGGRGGGPMPPRGMDEFGEEGMHGLQGGMGNGNMQNQQGCVLMVYGCAEGKINCQKLFNLFCLYGNVVRIKFLKSKEGAAMIQMGDMSACDRAIQNLTGCSVFGSKLSISFSKQAFIQDVPKPSQLSDGSTSFVDYMGTKNNRFLTPEAAAKNRVQAPSKALYFYNVPANIMEDEIKNIFIEAEVKPPNKIRIFPSKNEKSCTGIAEWDSKGDCIEALVATNHTTLANPAGKNPFILKFSFTGVGRE